MTLFRLPSRGCGGAMNATAEPVAFLRFAALITVAFGNGSVVFRCALFRSFLIAC